ncbi:MAG TPA: hypothetical protein G4N92_02045 [Anaerolineae bacterium]|nr:hypothetical protein [Anaerolineae bacterium]
MLESRESSSPVLTRAVSAALRGEHCNVYEFSTFQKVALSILGKLPQSLALWLIPRVQAPNSLNPQFAQSLMIRYFVNERINDYSQLKGQFPSLVTGVAIGGAAGHIAVLANGPFLPQAFVMTLQGGATDGNVLSYFNRSVEIARQFVSRNPNIKTIQHFDPIHDGWLTKYVNHLRIKLLDIPDEYKNFIRNRVKPGGEIIYLDGRTSWLQYQIDSRMVFQVGGWGGISSEEFLAGSQRIRDYCQSNQIEKSDWKLSEFPLIKGIESEWGSEPLFAQALQKFCQQEGYQFIPITFKNPHNFSKLAFTAYKDFYKKSGIEPQGTIIEMFSQYDLAAVQKGALQPLRLIFNTTDSLEFLTQMKAEFPKNKPVFFSPLVTFSITPDLVPFSGWESALNDFPFINIGARQSHYPADAKALIGWQKSLREWVGKNKIKIKGRLTGKKLLDIANTLELQD